MRLSSPVPLGNSSTLSHGFLECFSCGALEHRLARFEDDRGELILLCDECEEDVLDGLAEEAADRLPR